MRQTHPHIADSKSDPLQKAFLWLIIIDYALLALFFKSVIHAVFKRRNGDQLAARGL